jgi:hypothetical protein
MLFGHDQRRHAVTPSVPSAYSSTLPDEVIVKPELDRAARLERDQRRRGGPMIGRERAWPR